MSTRDDLVADIRRSLGVTGRETTRRAVVEDRLDRAPRGIIPQRGQLPAKERTALFRTMAEDAQASVESVNSAADVPRAVADFLRRHNLPATLRMGDDARLEGMPWKETALDVSTGVGRGSDLNAVSHAFGAVAETGTLVLTSGSDNPTTLNFLPDNHVVVVSAKDIAGDYESVWARLRAEHGKGLMPRTVNWVTGPSRSGDIEQVLQLGAHGPRRLHIVVVDE